MRKITALLAVVVAITGCDKLEKALGNGPVGRYQMVTSVGANTFILDTKSGSVWRFSENRFRFLPVTVEMTGKSPEDKRALLKSLKAQKNIHMDKLALLKQLKGLPLSPEDKKALLKSIEAQNNALMVKLALLKQQNGKSLSPEEQEALKKFTANE